MIRSFVFAAIVLTSAGCVSVLPEPESPGALYRISATAAYPAAQSVTVSEPSAPRVMAGQALVVEDAGGALRLLRGYEWSGRFTRLMQLALVDSLGEKAQLPETGIAAPYNLSVRVRFAGLMAGENGEEARCEVSWAVIDTAKRALEASGDVRLATPAGAQRALEMRRTAERCVAEVADAVAKALETSAS
ncbi:MAG: ABC-type transport auxiliary lipoprotein family protein [Pseudomonadota bacterium]